MKYKAVIPTPGPEMMLRRESPVSRSNPNSFRRREVDLATLELGECHFGAEPLHEHLLNLGFALEVVRIDIEFCHLIDQVPNKLVGAGSNRRR